MAEAPTGGLSTSFITNVRYFVNSIS